MPNTSSKRVNISGALALSLGLVFVSGCADDMAMKAKKMSSAHIGHVMTGWKDTPNKSGLLPTAIAEAKVAVAHAGFAAKKSRNLKWMKAHTAHVLHAVDPSAIAKGPGHGYGVIKAATGAANHVKFAAGKNASKNVKTHSVHVATSAGNAVAWAKEIAALCKKVAASRSVTRVARNVAKIKILTGRLLTGYDANKDGKISWKKGEGGLNEAKKHMGFMMKGEGIMMKGKG